MKRLALAFALLCLPPAVTAASAQVDTIDLQDEPGWLPYQFRIVHYSQPNGMWEHGWGASLIYSDLNGNGVDDHIKANEFGIVRGDIRELDIPEIWQNKFPAEFTGVGQGGAGTVDGIWDLDEDGRLEVLSTASTPDGFQWMIRAIDLETGDLHSEYRMQGGEDHYEDGKWDGKFRSFGVIDVPTGSGVRRGLVVAFMAGYDLLPRGVRVLEVGTGEVLWEFLAGPKIMAHTIKVVDVDGDGHDQVVFIGVGVDNLGGRLVNGTTDDHSRLFLLNRDGSLAWSHRLGDAPSGGYMDTFDFDGDGTREIAVGSFVPELQGMGVAIFKHDGTLWASEEVGGIPRSLTPLEGLDGIPNLLLTVGPLVRLYEVESGELSMKSEARFDSPVVVAAVADILGDDNPEFLVSTGSDQVWILDGSLKPQAFHHVQGGRFLKDNTFVTRRPDGGRRVISMGAGPNPQVHLDVVSNPRSVPWAAILTVSGVGGGALVAWRRRRKPQSKGTIRELRLQLLGRLKLSGHGAIGALSSVRRIIWHLETVTQGFEPDQRVMNLFRDLSDDTLQVGIPNMHAAVELAELARMDNDTVRAAKKSIDKLAVLLEGLAGSEFELDSMMAIREDLQATATEADQRFRELRHMVEDAFMAEPAVVLERSLAAHTDEMDDLGVEVVLDLDEAPAVQMDMEELAFIVDNLIENAVRAMHGSPEKRLSVSWQEAGEHVVLLIGDTGCGIPPDELELVMKPGHSKRQGGGLGLPRSQEILGKYGGGLSVKESSPGRGTTLSLLLPAVSRPTETH